jgi:uncharacterized C2H2 Zn-finger protein
MIAKNTPEFKKYLDSFSSREMVSLECPQCHKVFSKVKHDIQSKLGPHNNRDTICCSRKCLYESRITKQIVNCLQCGKIFIRHLNQIKKVSKHFCSSHCLGVYHNAHKTTGSRRSKLEKWLEERIQELFPNVEVIFNGTKAIKAELDIYLPAIKLAFELDGIFHFKPIFGEAKFLATQRTDLYKIKTCLEKDIQLVKIDVSSMKQFTPEASMKYLLQIQSLIDEKLK